jgi:hypothetical protein
MTKPHPFRIISGGETEDGEKPRSGPLKLIYLGFDAANYITSYENEINCMFNFHRPLVEDLHSNNLDISELWATVRTIYMVCENLRHDGIILPTSISKTAFFIFGAIHPLYPSKVLFTFFKGSDEKAYLAKLT